MSVGQEVVEETGEPARTTSVHRRVYDEGGKLLYDTTWSSYYRSEPRVVRYGTKPLPKPEKKPKDPNAEKPGATTGATETTPPVTGSPPPVEPAVTDPLPQRG
jgi:hypothetical protein